MHGENNKNPDRLAERSSITIRGEQGEQLAVIQDGCVHVVAANTPTGWARNLVLATIGWAGAKALAVGSGRVLEEELSPHIWKTPEFLSALARVERHHPELPLSDKRQLVPAYWLLSSAHRHAVSELDRRHVDEWLRGTQHRVLTRPSHLIALADRGVEFAAETDVPVSLLDPLVEAESGSPSRALLSAAKSARDERDLDTWAEQIVREATSQRQMSVREILSRFVASFVLPIQWFRNAGDAYTFRDLRVMLLVFPFVAALALLPIWFLVTIVQVWLTEPPR